MPWKRQSSLSAAHGRAPDVAERSRGWLRSVRAERALLGFLPSRPAAHRRIASWDKGTYPPRSAHTFVPAVHGFGEGGQGSRFSPTF